MTNLNTNPEALLTAKNGDVFTYFGHQLYVRVSYGSDIWLTTTDSRVDEYTALVEAAEKSNGIEPKYGDYIKHLRIGNVAKTTRRKLVDGIKDGLVHVS